MILCHLRQQHQQALYQQLGLARAGRGLHDERARGIQRLGTGGGILDETVRELHISVDPAEIPNHIDIDVSHLQVGKSLHVRDVKAPAGVTILDDPAGTICVCMIPKEVATPTPEEAAAAGAAPAEPELIRKPKAEDEEGAEGEEKK